MERSRARAAVDCRETGRGDAREDTLEGISCGRELGSHGSKVLTAESCIVGGVITIASLSTRQHRQLNDREAGPSNA